MADGYPSHLETLFRDLRTPIVAHLEEQDAASNPCPELGVLAILGEHLVIIFAMIADPQIRQTVMDEWIGQLPRAIDRVSAAIARKGERLQ